MRKRAISKEDVEYCIANNDTSSLSTEKNLQYWATLPNGKRIKVVLDQDSKAVITVMYIG